MFVTRFRIHKQKQNFATHFCLLTKLLANARICQLRQHGGCLSKFVDDTDK